MSETTGDPGCEDCGRLSGRVIVAVVAFAVFTAYVAADFALSGRITGWLAGMLTAAHGQAKQESAT